MKLPQDITTEELMQQDYRYCYTDDELISDWRRLCDTTVYKSGSQFKPGMKLCQHFCDNFWDIQNAAGKSFAQCWQDPEIMDRVRLWGLSGMSQLWLSWVRRAVFMAGGLPNSSFYRPHFAKQIAEQASVIGGTLFDPCAGWGGRMLGTVAAGWNYVACEPNPDTYQRLTQMAEFLNITHRVTLHNIPAEQFDWHTLDDKPDVILTSPPYFDLERYTDHQDQSYVKYDNFDQWRDHWYLPLIEQCVQQLNPAGISAWNVMNTGSHDLVEPMIECHRAHAWQLTDTVGFRSPLNNIRKLKNRDVTYLFRHQSWGH